MNLPVPQQTVQLPAHLQAFQSQQLSKVVAANIGSSAPPYLSIQGNRFTLIDAAGNDRPVGIMDPKLGIAVDCTVIDVLDRLSKTFYPADQPYDPNAPSFSPPACWSDNGIGPSWQASSPQSPTCGICPNNRWGSATSKVSGKGIKACHDQQKVAIMVPGYPTPFLLRIPPNSLKNFRAYAEQFNGQGFDMDLMMTRISFEPQGVGTLLFNAVNWIDAALAGAIQQVRQAKATDAMVGRNDVAREATPIGAASPPLAAQADYVVPAAALPAAPPASQLFPSPSTASPQPGMQSIPAPAAGIAPIASMQAAPSEQPQPTQRRRRRTAAEMQATQAPAAPTASAQAPFPHAATPAAAQAPFPHAAPAGFAPAAPPPTAPGATFGMAPGAAPDPGLMATLNSVFGQAQPK